MYEILIIAFLVIAIAIIGLVLIQHGKGADMGASFGAGASATLFGSAGTGNFLSRTTTILGILFFIISITLANISTKKSTSNSEFWNIESETPAVTTNETNNSQAIDQIIPESQQQGPTSDIPE